MSFSSILYLIKEGFRNIYNHRMMSLASVVVLVSCLIITGSAALISVNVNSIISSIGDEDQITVYLKPELSDLDSIKLGPELSALRNVDSYKYRSRDDVLKDYKKSLGDDIFEAMQGKGNPFGNEYKLKLRDLSKYNETAALIQKMDGVDTVSDRSDVAGKLTKLNYFVTVVGLWVVLVLAVVTLFIISNTIKMTMYSRRFEISIMKSVGATNTFIRIPFIIEAMVIGLASGLISSAVILSLYEPVRGAAAGVIGMIGPATQTAEQIWLPTLLVMSAIGMAIGLLGAVISMVRYLNKEGGAILGK